MSITDIMNDEINKRKSSIEETFQSLKSMPLDNEDEIESFIIEFEKFEKIFTNLSPSAEYASFINSTNNENTAVYSQKRKIFDRKVASGEIIPRKRKRRTP